MAAQTGRICCCCYLSLPMAPPRAATDHLHDKLLPLAGLCHARRQGMTQHTGDGVSDTETRLKGHTEGMWCFIWSCVHPVHLDPSTSSLIDCHACGWEMTQHTGGGLSNTKTRFKGHIEEKMEFSVVFRPSVASPFGSIHEQVPSGR